jgi:NADH-quinone oxidoreductase subunit L
MGGLRNKMPVTFWTFLIYTLAISGVPLTSGFLSKDSILAGTLAFGSLSGHILIPIIGFFVAGLTAFYMFRLVILTFMGEHKDGDRFKLIHESPKVMTIPLVILAALSFFIFFSMNPLDGGQGWLAQAVERPETVVPTSLAAPSTEVFEEAHHHAHYTAMFLSLAVAGLGILVAFATYYWKKISSDKIAEGAPSLHKFLLNKWYFDELYGWLFVNGTLAVTNVLKWFDNTIVDGIVNGSGWLTKIFATISGWFDTWVVDGLVNATAYLSGFFGIALKKTQTGKIQTYVILAVFGVMVLYFVMRLV